MQANVQNPVTLMVANVYLQPLFLNFDDATVPKAVISPEFRTVDANYGLSIVPVVTAPSQANNTNAWGTVTINGMTSLHLMLLGYMTAGSSANNKDVAFRVTRWYPVYLQRQDTSGNFKTDVYIPVAQTFTATIGNITTGGITTSTSTLFPDSTLPAYLADTIAAVSTAGTPDINLYSPTGDIPAILTLDVHGASFVSIEIKTGSASPDKAQVLYGLE